MTIFSIILLVTVILIFVVGIIGIVLPVIPSLPVVWGGIFLYGLFTNFSKITITVVIITGILMIVGTTLDFVAGIFGARVYGASWRGILGALLGTIVGLIVFNIIGMIIGGFLGAMIGEYLCYKKMHLAFKAGIGTIVGFVFGVVIKVVIAFSMISIFMFALF